MSDGNPEENFCYSGTNTHEKTFHWRIENFPMHAHRGNKTSSELFESSSGSQWCLTLCLEVDSVDEKDVDFITVYLENRKSDKKQFVKVKLSICDCFGNPIESNRTEVLFDSWDTSQKVFSMSKDYVMKDGLNRVLLVPNDVLTLRCEMTITAESPALMCESKDAFKTITIKDNPIVLSSTKVLIFFRPALLHGKVALWFALEKLKMLVVFVLWPAIGFLVPAVYRILRFLILNIFILFYDSIVWGIKKYKTSRNKHETDESHTSPRENSRYVNGNMSEQCKYYVVSEHDMRRVCNSLLNFQKYGNNGPPAVMGAENAKICLKPTYRDDRQQIMYGTPANHSNRYLPKSKQLDRKIPQITWPAHYSPI